VYESAPDDYQIEAALGLAAAGLGRAAEAIRHGERAVELLPVMKISVRARTVGARRACP
jgi:hypothetical protein